MSIEALKEQARRHEQKEEWAKALDQYKKAIAKLEADDQPDIGLYNRVGDLFVRVGNLDEAVGHYGKSVDLYLEAELPNNAIAVCKKIIRNVPDRHDAYLRIGQIRAQQGFLPDARTNFLTYAERMQQAGDLDESFRALVEFCDLAPDDVDVRMAVAEQMASHDRTDEAVEQLSVAYRKLMARGDGRAAELEDRIRALNPDADLSGVSGGMGAEPEGAFMAGSGIADDGEIVATFGDIEVGGGTAEDASVQDDGDGALAIPDFDIAGPDEGASMGAAAETDEEEGGFELPTFDVGSADETEEGAAPLPTFGFDADEEEDASPLPTFGLDDADEEEEAAPLPTFGLDDADEEEDAAPLPTFGLDDADEEEEAAPLPTFGLDDADEEEEAAPLPTFGLDDADEEEEAAPLPTFGLDDETPEPGEALEEAVEEAMAGAADALEVAPSAPVEEAVPAPLEDAAPEAGAAPEAPVTAELTMDGVRSAIASDPENVELRQRMVELAYRSGVEGDLVEAFLGLGGALQGQGQAARAKAAFQQALQYDPENEQAKAALGRSAPASQPVKEVAAHEDYVDLGALILGDDEEKTTRFVVAYEEPSGDEEADFAKMLSQFKEKVSQNLDADDVRAHHDLGTAYKEMGLLDEAVAEFQQALRASSSHLPTYELLGQTFMEMGKMDAAIRLLERALEVDFEIEDELIAIYYHLARAYEQQGNRESALEFYDRVFTLDINFADVTERLRALR